MTAVPELLPAKSCCGHVEAMPIYGLRMMCSLPTVEQPLAKEQPAIWPGHGLHACLTQSHNPCPLQASEAAATRVFQGCIAALWKHEVLLEAVLLKPQMVVPGDVSTQRATPEEIASASLRALRRCAAFQLARLGHGLTHQGRH